MERGRGGKGESEGWGRPPALLPPPTGFCLNYHPAYDHCDKDDVGHYTTVEASHLC